MSKLEYPYRCKQKPLAKPRMCRKKSGTTRVCVFTMKRGQRASMCGGRERERERDREKERGKRSELYALLFQCYTYSLLCSSKSEGCRIKVVMFISYLYVYVKYPTLYANGYIREKEKILWLILQLSLQTDVLL